MKFVVITTPEFIPHEEDYIRSLFSCGIDILHFRKPGASGTECARLIEAIPQEYHSHIVVHDHFTLCRDYNLQGVHLNHRNPELPSSFHPLTVSASCHAPDELRHKKESCNYVFLSPIFDSISKQGYSSAFSDTVLTQAASSGLIDEKVIALGGVSEKNISQIRQWQFGGAAFLGAIWSRAGNNDFEDYLRRLRRWLNAC